MNLLFTRSQSSSSPVSLIPLRIGTGVTFSLNAELEFEEDEMKLAKQYGFTDASLTDSDTMADLAAAFRPAVLLSIAITLIAAFTVESSRRGIDGLFNKIGSVATIGISAMLLLTVMYFFAMRKHISVGQLLNGGRTFYCNSVSDLDAKEQELLDLAGLLYKHLEKSKNWNGCELHKLPDGTVKIIEKKPEPVPVTMPDPSEPVIDVTTGLIAGAASMLGLSKHHKISDTKPTST